MKLDMYYHPQHIPTHPNMNTDLDICIYELSSQSFGLL